MRNPVYSKDGGYVPRHEDILGNHGSIPQTFAASCGSFPFALIGFVADLRGL